METERKPCPEARPVKVLFRWGGRLIEISVCEVCGFEAFRLTEGKPYHGTQYYGRPDDLRRRTEME